MRLFCILTLAAATGTVWAQQQLSTEVIVDRDVVPQQRIAVRPSWLTPTVNLGEAAPVVLEPAQYTHLSAITRSFSVLSPAAGAFAAEKSPFRGYVAAGYFPTLDFGVAAGYRLVDRENMTLNAYVHFSDERYTPFKDDGDDTRQYFVSGGAGVDFLWHPVRESALKAYARYDHLRESTTYWYPQSVNSGSFGAGWQSKAGILDYYVKAHADLESSGDTHSYITAIGESSLLKGLSQQDFCFDLGASVAAGPGKAGVDISGDFLHTLSTDGIVGITPYYDYSNGAFKARLGVKLDIAGKFNVMPDVRLSVAPAGPFAAWLDFGGGSVNNSFARMRQECVYQVFANPFVQSKVPFTVEGGINIGPFKGFSVGAFGGYAVADSWLMDSDGVFTAFSPVDIKGWHAGVKATARWRMIKAEASVDFAPCGYDRAWYLRRDRAATVVEATIEVNPVKPLTVAVGYEFRNRRRAYRNDTFYTDLGCVSNLSAGAEWRFSEALAVFVRTENILCRRYMMVAWEPSRKLSGLFGVSYKF